MARGKKIEFINHFKLSRVGIHLLIYCQVVTWSVISALGPRRNRQAAAMAAVLWERTQGRTGMPAEGGRKLPWLGARASCSPLEEGTGAWLSRGSISCMAAKSTAFGSSLTLLWVIYHPTIFFSFPITSMKQQILSSSFSIPAFAVCFQTAIWASCMRSSAAAQWRGASLCHPLEVLDGLHPAQLLPHPLQGEQLAGSGAGSHVMGWRITCVCVQCSPLSISVWSVRAKGRAVPRHHIGCCLDSDY